ncbi:response regulator transcription factor [Streptomyces virginiae]|uniref:response regulator n=1 Tax=Streptomyces virginiae TaxID=1961 RepID=UPI00381BAE5D
MVVADDQEMVRTGFRTTLESPPDIEVLADAAEHHPDVLLLDIRMPGLDGLEATRRPSGSDRPRIVIVTPFDLDAYVHAALHAERPASSSRTRARPCWLMPYGRPAITVRLLREVAHGPAAPANRSPNANATSYAASPAARRTPRPGKKRPGRYTA